jgi:P-type Cu+ transporter
MALEPRTVSAAPEEDNAELRDMTRRFWISLGLSLPLLAFATSDMLPSSPLRHIASPRAIAWMQLVLATPVVLWGGRPFFERAWASIVNRSLNMFTLIALGTGAAWIPCVIAWDLELDEFGPVEGPGGVTTWEEADEASRFTE